jgi:uncharacterized protein
MKMHHFTVGSCFVLVFFSVIMLSSAQDTKDVLKNRMQSRFAELQELKSSGKIGENPMGFLEPVSGKYAQDAAIAKFIVDENADRSALYSLIAKETATAADEVGRANAKRIFQKAPGTDHFKAMDGSWKQKKDMAIP